jgi:hypothetical protein
MVFEKTNLRNELKKIFEMMKIRTDMRKIQLLSEID